MSEEQEFSVNDRRIRHEEEPPKPSGEPSGGAGKAASAPSGGEAPAGFTTSDEPSMDFSTFVLSLSQSAFIHMGLVAHPDTGKAEKNLAVARQNIDILSLLEEKTRGNLTDEEGDLITQMLYTLRMRFVAASREDDAEAGGAAATSSQAGG